jgi:putative transposase
MGDHLHLFVGLRPDQSISRVVQVLKSVSARKLFQQFPHLKRRYWGGHLWSRGKFYCSVGAVNSETVRHYILQSQGVKHTTQRIRQTKITDYSKQ